MTDKKSFFTNEDKIEWVENQLIVAEKAKEKNRFFFEMDLGGLVVYEALQHYLKLLQEEVNNGSNS
jgi:hypothetical protein